MLDPGLFPPFLVFTCSALIPGKSPIGGGGGGGIGMLDTSMPDLRLGASGIATWSTVSHFLSLLAKENGVRECGGKACGKE